MPNAFFEGPEKKLEVLMVPGSPPLRALGRELWEEVVQAARASVLSVESTGTFDAYLLSESSLFVFDDRATMITCGRTRLVDAALRLLEHLDRDRVALLVYERKNEHFPERQHTTFLDDARRLDAVIPGAAYRFGVEHAHRIEMFVSSRDYAPDPGDTTLEVLMHGLDADRCAAFTAPAPQRTARALGLDRILPGFSIDEFAFEPAGYSLNGLRGSDYYTIHVTPEREGSYASFETTWDFRADPSGVVKSVVELFRPESFDVLAFTPDGSPVDVELAGYQRRKHVSGEVAGYLVTFLSFYAPMGIEAPLPLVFRR